MPAGSEGTQWIDRVSPQPPRSSTLPSTSLASLSHASLRFHTRRAISLLRKRGVQNGDAGRSWHPHMQCVPHTLAASLGASPLLWHVSLCFSHLLRFRRDTVSVRWCGLCADGVRRARRSTMLRSTLLLAAVAFTSAVELNGDNFEGELSSTILHADLLVSPCECGEGVAHGGNGACSCVPCGSDHLHCSLWLILSLVSIAVVCGSKGRDDLIFEVLVLVGRESATRAILLHHSPECLPLTHHCATS